MKLENVFYLPSGRIFLYRTEDDYLIECTEMRDVSVGGKGHLEVRQSTDPHVIWKHLVDYKDKWLLTVSTQKGCPHNCRFCDVAPLPFCGNLSSDEIIQQIRFLLQNTPYVQQSNKVKIGFARMGEPAHNTQNVLSVIKQLPIISREMNRNIKWLPCFNSILPTTTLEKKSGYNVISDVIYTKEYCCDGYLHFQISCNSTDEDTRKDLFGHTSVLPLKNIIDFINRRVITHRTVTLNFIVMDGIEVSVDKLKHMGVDSGKFTVKLIPLNQTKNATQNKLNTYANYSNYEKLERLGEEFNKIGVPTVIDAIAKCEEAGLCCGQLAQIYQ